MEDENVTAIFQIDMRCSCQSCTEKVFKCAFYSHEALNSPVTIDQDGEIYKVTITGKIDPLKLRKKMEKKLKKTVRLISPKLDKGETETKHKEECKEPALPIKMKSRMKIEENGPVYKVTMAGTMKKLDKKETEIERKYKSKELPLTTALFKLPLYCKTCSDKIHKIITRTRGCRNVGMDLENNLVRVTGTIDVNSLVEALRHQLIFW